MATKVRFNGRLTAIPQSFTSFDEDALNALPENPRGVVAVIGDAVGGRPVSADMEPSDFLTVSSAQGEDAVKQMFASGDLREAGLILFNPSADDEIVAGPSNIVFMKTNQATRASGTFDALLPSQATMSLESAAYGVLGNQTAVTISGTAPARSFTISRPGSQDEAISVSGASRFSLLYAPPGATTSAGWTTALGMAHVDAFRVFATRTATSEIANLDTGSTLTGAFSITVTASGGGFATPTIITVYTRNASNVLAQRKVTVTANGTYIIPVGAAGAVLAASSSRPLTGSENVAITDTTSTDPCFTSDLSITLQRIGCHEPMGGLDVASSRYGAAGSVANGVLYVWGRDTSGLPVGVTTALSATVNRYVASATALTKIEAIITTELVAATVVTVFAMAYSDSVDSVTGLAALYANRGGFTFEQLIQADFDPDLLDYAVTAGSSLLTTPAEYKSILEDSISVINDASALVTAERVEYVAQVYEITGTATASGTWTLSAGGASAVMTTATTDEETEFAAFVKVWNATPTCAQLFLATSFGTTMTLTGRTGTTWTVIGTPAGGNAISVTQATALAGPGQYPANTVAPVSLVGGSEGVATQTEYDLALALLERVTVNAVCVMSSDPAIHASVKAHVEKMLDRRAYVGLSALDISDLPTGELPTETEIKDQIKALNSKYMSAVAENVDLVLEGRTVTRDARFTALVLCGMEMGATPGLPVTNKIANVVKVARDTSWNTAAGFERMLDAGLTFLRDLNTKGIRWVRGLTTWLRDDNLARIESSINRVETLLFIRIQNYASELVGSRGSPDFLTTAKIGYKSVINAAIPAGELVSWDAATLVLKLSGDRMDVIFSGVPPVPVNFVFNKVVFTLPVFFA